MMVNGAPRWTCRTHIDRVVRDDRVRISPLRNLPVIRDLAVDMTEFFDKWQKAKARFVPSEPEKQGFAAVDQKSRQRKQASAAIECINCGVCFAACDSVRWNDDYFGPAALNRAWTLVNDVRDAGNKERLKAVAAKGGCHNCHSHQSCEQLCPQALNPTASIAGLKRRTMQAYIRGEL